jgi:hypothetical protein
MFGSFLPIFAELYQDSLITQLLAQQLKDDDINFESVEITKLQSHLLTRDLFSLTKALLHLGDKLAWLSVLRAPQWHFYLLHLSLIANWHTKLHLDARHYFLEIFY